MKLTIHEDHENDQCYIAIGEEAFHAGVVTKTVAAVDDVALDFDSDGRLVGIDIQNAEALLGTGLKTTPVVDFLVGVKEAATLAGVKSSNFIRDYANRPDFPQPVADLASGRIWAHTDVVAYIKARQARSLAS